MKRTGKLISGKQQQQQKTGVVMLKTAQTDLPAKNMSGGEKNHFIELKDSIHFVGI